MNLVLCRGLDKGGGGGYMFFPLPHCLVGQSQHSTALILDFERSLQSPLVSGLRQLAMAWTPPPKTHTKKDHVFSVTWG